MPGVVLAPGTSTHLSGAIWLTNETAVPLPGTLLRENDGVPSCGATDEAGAVASEQAVTTTSRETKVAASARIRCKVPSMGGAAERAARVVRGVTSAPVEPAEAGPAERRAKRRAGVSAGTESTPSGLISSCTGPAHIADRPAT
ncbi:hypothetical protein tb265_25850 [Gemmatimonadetes bacterium T265]|nr:hypothetical protein tb265_25850 [Gemmatimonadetes bacterium T265]